MRPAVTLIGALAAALVLAAGSAADSNPAHSLAKPRSRQVDLRLSGAPLRRTDVCGITRRATVAPRGRRVIAIVRTGRRGARLSVERCRRGRWGRLSRAAIRSNRRTRHRLARRSPGAYRVRARAVGRGAGRGRVAYLKVLPERSVAGAAVERAVAFKVNNVNRSRVGCPSDGAAHTVRGHLVGPKAKLQASGGALTIYLHDLGLGEWFWRFRAVPGLDFAAEQAEAGHVSLTLDELGYDSSDRPEGTGVCVGSHADVLHQIVGALRAGSFSTTGTPVSFKRVAVAGQSTGAQIAQIAAYSFKDIDALAVLGWSDQGSSEQAQNEFTKAGVVCAGGGQRADGDSGPGGYAYFGQTDADFRASFFNSENTDPRVIARATPMRNRAPCGDFASTPPGIVVDEAALSEVSVPVLLLYGERDAAYPPEGERSQRQSFSGSNDVTSVIVPNSGHAFTLERSAASFRTAVSRWLSARGF